MELLLTTTHFVIKKDDDLLFCDRSSEGKLVPKKDTNLGLEDNFAHIGLIYGFIGKIRFFPDGCWHLILITRKSRVSNNIDPQIFRIDKVALIPLSNNLPPNFLEFDLPPTVKRSDLQLILNDFIKKDYETYNTNTTSELSDSKANRKPTSTLNREFSRRGKIEARLCDAFLRMFCESNFYYSPECDLTSSLQRRFHYASKKNLWSNFDDRFFWNKEMLKELLKYEEEIASPWILPIIQGFYDIICCPLDILALPSLLTEDYSEHNSNTSFSDNREERHFQDFQNIDPVSSQLNNDLEFCKPLGTFCLALISRRSRYRAGTRYKRRGIDIHGNVANFVESELIIMIETQKISFVQVRGSIPIFWSQPGNNYRPQPLISKDNLLNQNALEYHILDQFKHYRQLSIINLVNEFGMESIVKSAFEKYLHNIQQHHDINYVYFDFNKHCRGFQLLKFQNLLCKIEDQIENYKFFWSNAKNDQHIDLLCEQTGVFRVNCMDCLDRTNVVQTNIACQVLEIALMKLGLLMPDQALPSSCLQALRRLWANNGDAISRQYAGTAALKGDLTRTGHRNIKGTVRDGLSSANRYYINHFKDSLRQCVIDSMQDDFISDSIKYDNPGWNDLDTEGEVNNSSSSLISAIKDYLDLDETICGWALKEPDGFKCISSAPSDQCILILLNFAILIILYDNATDDILSYEFIEFDLIEKVQFGILSKYKLLERKHAIRIHFIRNQTTRYHYTFCSLFQKPDEIKLELNIINNELKFQTSLLNLFPIFVSVKISSRPSFGHDINEISNLSGDSFSQLKFLINEKFKSFSHTEQKDSNIFIKDVGARVHSASIEDLISNDYPQPLKIELPRQPNKKSGLSFPSSDFDSIINDSSSISVRKSISDESIYSHSSNTGVISPASSISFEPSRHRAETFSANFALLSPYKSQRLLESTNYQLQTNNSLEFVNTLNSTVDKSTNGTNTSHI